MTGCRPFGLFSLITIPIFILLGGCVADKQCPDNYICITGNTISYSEGPGSPKITLEAPPEAVYNNTQIFFSDLSADPALDDNPERFFCKTCFRVEPQSIGLRQLVKISLQYTPGSQIDSIGNDFGPQLRLYSIDDYGTWSLVPASVTDTALQTTVGQVLFLGKFAIAAPKHCLVGEWWNGTPTGAFGFSYRIRFWKNGTGQLARVVDCDPSGTDDFQLALTTFSWYTENATLVLTGISDEIACGNPTPPAATTVANPYTCGSDELSVNFGSGSLTYTRRF